MYVLANQKDKEQQEYTLTIEPEEDSKSKESVKISKEVDQIHFTVDAMIFGQLGYIVGGLIWMFSINRLSKIYLEY